MVNLEWYRTFKAVYEEGTLTAAAQRLFVSQPGVSLHLSSLEAYVGSALFDRIAKRMIPTDMGKHLYHALSEPMSMLLDIENQFQKTPESDVPTLTIGMCFETFQLSFEKQIHNLNFNLINRFSNYQQLLKELEQGQADVIITPHKSKAKGIEFIPVMKETIVLVGSADIDPTPFRELFKKEDRKAMSEWMMNQKWYGASSDNEHFMRFWRQNFKSLPTFRQHYIVPNFISIVRTLGYGTGVAIAPDFLCKSAFEDNKLQLIWDGFQPLQNQLYFAYRRNTIHKREVHDLLKIFCEEMQTKGC